MAENIAVSGSGFPTHAQDPTGLQIIECSDPLGSPANLPTDPSAGCEGITVNSSQIDTDGAGRFHTSYPDRSAEHGRGDVEHRLRRDASMCAVGRH